MLAFILNYYLGSYLTVGSLGISIFSGHITLINVELSPDLSATLSLPVHVHQLSVKEIIIKIPWYDITNDY